MSHIPIETIIFQFFIVSMPIIAVIATKTLLEGNQKKTLLTEIAVLTIEDAHRISKEWGLGSLCCVDSQENGNHLHLSFPLSSDDMEKIETLLYYEQENGWQLNHPPYSALPMFSKQIPLPRSCSIQRFYSNLEAELAKTHPDWKFITNDAVKIICF